MLFASRTNKLLTINNILYLAIAVSLLIIIIGDIPADVTFTDVTAQAGIDNTAKAACVAFVDYDGDGYLDIYVGNSGKFPEPLGKPNLLYRNNGDGTFTDMAVDAGIADDRQTQGVGIGDFDNDGDPDIYVVNDFGLNALYLNNGDGSFQDATDAAGVQGAVDIIGGEEAPNGYGVALRQARAQREQPTALGVRSYHRSDNEGEDRWSH